MPADAPVTRLELESLALAQLPAERADALRLALAHDDDLAARYGQIEAGIAAARIDLPTLELPVEPPSSGTAVSTTHPGWPRWASLALPVLAVAAAVLLWLGVGRSQAVEPTPVIWRGAFEMQAHLLRHGEPRPVGAVVEARAGDVLQLELRPARDGLLHVFDLQDDGEVFAWTPAQPVQAGRTVRKAWSLDDYAGAERIFVIIGPEELGVVDVREAWERSWRQPLIDLDTLPGLPGAQRSLLVVDPAAR